jgi:2-phospho-L-lactate transferase/gluconeogenesis factor (CofD/UPF0052 family)
LIFLFIGILLLSLGVAFLLIWTYRSVPVPGYIYYLTLQFLPVAMRSLLLIILGLGALAIGIWKLSGVVIFRLGLEEIEENRVILGYQFDRPLNIVVLSGGAGMLVLSSLSEHARQITCITPLQDSIEYYYRASSTIQAHNVHYVVPTPVTPRVYAELDDGTVLNVMRVDHHPELAERYVSRLFLVDDQESPEKISPADQPLPTPQPGKALPLTRPAADSLRQADAIILGPGSLFESIIPNLMIDELREAIQQSKARKIYICNLMTEPGLTTGFSVSDHIRSIKRYGEFTPDYVLVNVQRIESEVQQIYAAAHQVPVYLTPEEYEETQVPISKSVAQRQLVIEDSVVIEADLASSIVRYTASINNPEESWAVRVLRHDPEKLTTAILELLRRQ